MTTYTFQQIMTNIGNNTITTTSDTQILISRQEYIDIITNSSGNISAINLPIISVNIINFNVSYFNFNLSFPFVLTDFTTATDWVTYTLPT